MALVIPGILGKAGGAMIVPGILAKIFAGFFQAAGGGRVIIFAPELREVSYDPEGRVLTFNAEIRVVGYDRDLRVIVFPPEERSA